MGVVTGHGGGLVPPPLDGRGNDVGGAAGDRTLTAKGV